MNKKWAIIIFMISVMGVCSVGYLDSQGEIDVVQTMDVFVQSFAGEELIPGEPEAKKERPTTRNVIKTEYTYNTKLEEYDDGTGNAIIYLGMRYADSSGVKIEDATSLKTCEFCSNIKLGIQEDRKYPVKVIDYNLTSITLDVQADISELNKDIPLKVYNKENESDIKFETTARLTDVSAKQGFVIPFGFDKVIKWGGNSTIITITDVGQDVSIDDTAISGDTRRGVFRINISSTPKGSDITINEVLFVDKVNAISETVDDDAELWRLKNQTWTELISAAEIDVLIDNRLDNNEQTKVYNITPVAGKVIGIEVTTQFMADYNTTNESFTLVIGDIDGDPWNGVVGGVSNGNNIPIGDSSPGRITLCDREGSGACNIGEIYLQINYSYINLTITDPTTASPASKNPSEKLTVRFNFTDTGILQTSGVTQENVTIGGEICVPFTNTYCSGTPDACDTYSTEAECNFNGTSCNWAIPIDYTTSNCGTNCHGGDTTYPSEPSCTDYILADACGGASSCDGTDTVVDLTLNGTDFLNGDNIKVTLDVMCFGTGDEIKIWYYNGASWNEEFYDATCAGQGANQIIDTIVIDSASATQYIRGQVTYETLSGDDECYTGTFGDNDDIAFGVVPGGLCSGTVSSCSDTNYVNESSCTGAGCDYGAVNEYVNNALGWELNCTVGAGCTGNNNLFVNATYRGNTYNETQTNAVDCGGAADSCSCPASGDWNIDCSDNCNIATDCDMQGNTIYASGAGTVSVDATISNFDNAFFHCDMFCRNTPTCFG